MNERDDQWWIEQDDDERWVQAMLDQEAREQMEELAMQKAEHIQPYQYEFNFEVAK